MEPDNTSPARERATSPPPAALRFQESVASPSASASSPTQSNAFSTPPRPILLQGSFGRTAGQASGGSKGRLIELREPERARVAGRERTNVLSTTNLHPQLGPHAGIEGEASSRATGGSVSFRGLGPGETRLDVPSAAAPGGPSQDAPQQSTPGSAHYTAQGLPLFAEQFSTPLRRRKRANSSSASAAATTLTSPLAARVPTPPNEDDSTDDLYRGPLPPPEAPQRRTFRFDTSGRQLDEDAVSLRSMSTSDSASTKSSSSSSSRASVVSFVVGAFEAVGRGLGVLSSASSGSSSSSSSDSDSDAGRRPWHRRRSRRRSSTSTVRGSARVDLEAGASTAGKRRSKHNSRKKKRTRRRMRRLRRLRAFSFAGSASGTSRRGSSSSGSSGSSSSSSSSSGSNSSSSSSSSDDEPLGRRKVLGTREFRLMLPPERAQDKPSPTYLSPPIPGGLGDLPIPIHDQDQDGMIVTQSLDEIVMSINRLRSAEFHIPTPPPPQAFSQPVPPIVSVPQPLSTTIQIPPTAFDASRPLTPSQVLNIAPPSPSTTLPIFSGGPLSPHPSAVPSRLLEPKQQFPVSPDRTPPGSRSSSLRREVRLPLPEVRIDGPTPLPSPMGEKSEYEASLGNGEGTGLKAPLKPAWWLDVSCPTWEDMRSLGELLSLHPLTLEDILQQEPREKLEVFDALDYYLISFRALDESYFRYTDDGATGTAADTSGLRGRRKGRGKVEIVEDRPGKEGLEGVGVGGISLYIVVMRDGVVSFHFEDVKKHVASVTQRVQGLEPGFHLSSDWIAHMFMDSMVDVFMPLIDFIEDEADEIDSRIVHHDTQGSSPLAALADAEDAFVQEERRRLSEEEAEREKAAARASSASGDGSSGSSDDFVRKQKEAGLEAHELQSHPRRPSSARADDSSPNQDLSTRTTLAAWIQGQSHWFKIEKGDFIFVRRTVLAFYPLIARTLIILSLHPAQRQARKLRREAKRGPKLNFHDFDRKLMLKRMVGMRRLVTGLNRLLVTKNEVVGRLRKRAADMRRSSPRSATDLSEQMSTYFGDIQDHILSMQQTLAYCEHVLASSQPAYLSQLGIASRSARNGTQSSILALSFVTIGVLPLQIVLGVNSVNVNLPHNGDPENKLPGYPFNVWGIVIVACFVLAVLYILLIRYWKRVAKARSNERRQIFI